MTKSCSIEGCGQMVKARGWCSKHYRRWWIHGTPELLRPKLDGCRVAGCSRPPRSESAGICEVHYYRLRRTGSVEKSTPVRMERPSYRAAHSRIGRDRGKAKTHICADCDALGAHWSFAWKRVDRKVWLWEHVNGTLLAYTADPFDYDPRCRSTRFHAKDQSQGLAMGTRHSCARRYDGDFPRENDNG